MSLATRRIDCWFYVSRALDRRQAAAMICAVPCGAMCAVPVAIVLMQL
jgi:hypothetical protein